MKYTHVLFDLDGTLLDTSQSIMESACYAIDQMGYLRLDPSVMRSFVGPPIQESFMRHYGCDEALAQKAANLFRGYYIANALFKADPYEGIYNVFNTLKEKNVTLAVATYKREDYALTILEHFGFSDYCQAMHGGDNENKLKKPDIIVKCMQEMHAVPKNCLYVGDTMPDALAAQKAGVDFLAVSYGFGFKAGQSVADIPNCIGLCNTPLEILSFLE